MKNNLDYFEMWSGYCMSYFVGKDILFDNANIIMKEKIIEDSTIYGGECVMVYSDIFWTNF
jgi:hypothetical protein